MDVIVSFLLYTLMLGIRKTGDNGQNHTSSRSHTVLGIRVQSRCSGDGTARMATLVRRGE